MSHAIKTALCTCGLALLAACASTPEVATAKKETKAERGFSPFKGKRADSKKPQLTTVPSESLPAGLDPVANAAFWGTRYDRNPKDAKVAVNFSTALREVGSNEEALKVMQQSQIGHPDDAGTLLELSKTLIANQRAFEAIRPLERAIALGKGEDWSAVMAYGVALDSIGEHKEARRQYDVALTMTPKQKEYVVLNNKGLSYALSGKLKLAELTLREATSNAGGTAQVRQNLALVLGLAGKHNEAERLARSDLPPRIADNNAAYFRSLVSQPAYWAELNRDNAELPVFSGASAPSTPVETDQNWTPAPAVTPAPQQPVEPFEQPTYKDDGEVLSWSAPSTGEGTGISAPTATGQPVQLENTSAEQDKIGDGMIWADDDPGS